MDVMQQDIKAKDHNDCMLLDGNEWRKLIHVSDPA